MILEIGVDFNRGVSKTERSLFALPCILVLTNCFLSGIVYGIERKDWYGNWSSTNAYSVSRERDREVARLYWEAGNKT